MLDIKVIIKLSGDSRLKPLIKNKKTLRFRASAVKNPHQRLFAWGRVAVSGLTQHPLPQHGVLRPFRVSH
jgi:hypothetical protein